MNYHGKLYGSTDGKKFVEMEMTGLDIDHLKHDLDAKRLQMDDVLDRLKTAVQAFKIIIDGDPVSIGLDEVEELCRKALDYCEVDYEN